MEPSKPICYGPVRIQSTLEILRGVIFEFSFSLFFLDMWFGFRVYTDNSDGFADLANSCHCDEFPVNQQYSLGFACHMVWMQCISNNFSSIDKHTLIHKVDKPPPFLTRVFRAALKAWISHCIIKLTSYAAFLFALFPYTKRPKEDHLWILGHTTPRQFFCYNNWEISRTLIGWEPARSTRVNRGKCSRFVKWLQTYSGVILRCLEQSSK